MPEDKVINKVVYGGDTLMDITDTTATETDVVSGKDFYLASGKKSSGTLMVPSKTSDLINDSGFITKAIYYGTSSSAAADEIKIVTCSDFGTLEAGDAILVRFSATNSAAVANLKLNVNDTGAVSVKYINNGTLGNLSSAGYLKANTTYLFVYDGTYWVVYLNYNTTYSSMTDAEITAGTGTTARTITPARLKTAIQTWEHVHSVNGETGDVTLDIPEVSDWAKASSKPSYTASEVGAVATSAVGAASGVAPLNASSKIDETYLPSYVDDVIEGYLYNGTFYKEAAHTTAITAEAGKIYVDLTTDKTYRYGGSTYVEISSGTTVSVSRDLTSGTKIGTITVNGTGADIYAPTPPTKVSDLTNDSGYVNAAGAASAAPVQSVNGETGDVTLDIPEVPDWALEENPPTYALSYDENSIGSSYTDTATTIEPNYTPSGDVVMDYEIVGTKLYINGFRFIGSGVKFVINSNVNSNAVGTGAADYMEI